MFIYCFIIVLFIIFVIQRITWLSHLYLSILNAIILAVLFTVIIKFITIAKLLSKISLNYSNLYNFHIFVITIRFKS